MTSEPFTIRSRRRVHLGPVSIEIRSNEARFAGFRFFVREDQTRDMPGQKPDFTLNLCNVKVDGPWPLDQLAARHDRSYRGKKMSAGYYLTDHFGAPAYLLSQGTEYWIYAENFEPILWPYAIKHLLTVYSMEHGMLHLKAAAVAIDGRGALLVGRGGSGKTVLLNCLCREGALFLSNTHALLEGNTIWGIPTAMRVRRDAFFAPIIAGSGLSASVKAGEYTLDPLADLGWRSARSATLRTICLLDYKDPGQRSVREIGRDVVFDYMEQFSLAVNVYGLKEDILDHLGGDLARFSVDASRVRAGLRALIEGSRCYYVSCDAADAGNLRAIRGLLGGPEE